MPDIHWSLFFYTNSDYVNGRFPRASVMVVVIGLDINTFNPATVELSVNIAIAHKLDWFHEHRFGY